VRTVVVDEVGIVVVEMGEKVVVVGMIVGIDVVEVVIMVGVMMVVELGIIVVGIWRVLL
jgi:hypothetical protein